MKTDTFSTTGCVIHGPDDRIGCVTVNAAWADLIAARLNEADRKGFRQALKAEKRRKRLCRSHDWEILDPDGNVVAWAAHPDWAAVIVGLLNSKECSGDTPVATQEVV